MGGLIVARRARQAPPQKSRVAGPGGPGARGSPAAGRAGPGCRPGAAAAPRPGSWCCSSALARSSRPRPASQPPAQVRGLGTREGSAAGGARKDRGEGGHWAATPSSWRPRLTVDGEWASWSPWSSCPEPCTGTMTRQRHCRPPQNGGWTCAMLPGGPHSARQTREWDGGGRGGRGAEGLLAGRLCLQGSPPPDLQSCSLSEPCPQDSCPNATCSGELVFWPCAPCPLTCDDISSQVVCPADRPCSSPGEGAPGSGVAGELSRPSPLQGSPALGFPQAAGAPRGRCWAARAAACGPDSAPAWWTAPATGLDSASRPTASSASAETGGPRAAGPALTAQVRPTPALPGGAPGLLLDRPAGCPPSSGP